MASISKQKNGLKTVQFVGGDGRRRSIRLGKCTMKHAQEVKTRVEHIHAAKKAGLPLDSDTAGWLAEIGDGLAEKLAAVGLIPPREGKAVETLGPFVALYIEEHGPTVKPETTKTWRHCKGLLLEHFDAETPLQSITEGHAVSWRTYLLKRHNTRQKETPRKLSEATIRKRCAIARQFFEHALRLRLIESNPFKSKRIPTSLPKGQQKEFVSAELAHKIMDKLPDWQWRLLFALARWGGVRVGSEPRRLTWPDVDWERKRMTIHSSKTEHHEGHERRVIPIFEELAGPLEEAWDMADEGQVYVLPMLQGRTDASLRKPLLAAIEAAGGEPWPKLWTALRATRDTELRGSEAGHVVDAWIGHDYQVAKRSYLQVTEEHFSRWAAGGAESGAPAVQNAVQHQSAGNRTKPQPSTQSVDGVESYAEGCEKVRLAAEEKGVDEGTRTPDFRNHNPTL